MVSTITDLVYSIDTPRFARVLAEARNCASQRGRTLNFRRAEHRVEIRCDVEDRVIAIYLHPEANSEDFEHHAAHELCHAIAGCCGFSFVVDLPTGLWEKFRSGMEDEVENALVQLQSRLGSVMTHIPVHKILFSAGYDAPNLDNYLVIEAQSKGALEPSLANRAVNVGWAIQYEELSKRNLPGLDVEEFKSQLRRLLPFFDSDHQFVRARTEVGNLFDVHGCIASTKSLANALISLIGYRHRDVFNIEVAHRPSPEWTLDATIRRLSRGTTFLVPSWTNYWRR